MNLVDVVRRQTVPAPWEEGEKIPWHEPGFSRRMLREHLSQDHDAASRRFEVVDRQVGWIHQELLGANPTRILDLGCGPGLYASRLAGLGHECVGLDYSPASVAYARQRAEEEKLQCTYVLGDIREMNYGAGYGLVMLIFGEFNVFTPADAKRILFKARRALRKGGLLLLEPHTYFAVRKMGEAPPSWYSADGGLFSDRPHICLKESFWDGEREVATERYLIIDAMTGEVTQHAASVQAYTNERYQSLLAGCGFAEVEIHASLVGQRQDSQSEFLAISAQCSSGIGNPAIVGTVRKGAP